MQWLPSKAPTPHGKQGSCRQNPRSSSKELLFYSLFLYLLEKPIIMKYLLVVLLAFPLLMFGQTEEKNLTLKKKLKKYLNFQHFMALLTEEHQYLMMIFIL